MKKLKYFAPNLLTSLNLLSGAIAVVTAFQGYETLPVYFLLAAALFDFLDGFVAKILGATSDFGKQLDSLSDLVSFGFAPSVLIFILQQKELHMHFSFILNNLILYSSFLFLVFAALRLARFNIQSSGTSDFIGLPVPAATLVVVSVWIILINEKVSLIYNILRGPYSLVILTLAISSLMVSRVSMLSLKFKGYGFKPNKWRYLLLIGAIVLFIIFWTKALFWIMVYYIALSIIKALFFH